MKASVHDETFSSHIKRLLWGITSLIFFTLPPHFTPPFSIPPQLTAQKHKNSKYGDWYTEASGTWWSLPLPVVHLDSEADRLFGGSVSRILGRPAKCHVRSWLLIILQRRVAGIFFIPEKSLSNFLRKYLWLYLENFTIPKINGNDDFKVSPY